MKLLFAFLWVVIAILGATAYKDYTNYSVLKVTPKDASHVKYLRTLESRDQIEIMSALQLNRPVYIMTSSTKLTITDQVFLSGLEPSVHIENVQRFVMKFHPILMQPVKIFKFLPWLQWGIDEERSRIQERYRADPYSFDLNDFNTFEAVMAQMEKWEKMCPSALTCTLYSIGKTFEDREIKMIKVTKTGSSNPAFWLDSTIHAREWLSLATIQNIMDHVFKDYGTDAEVTSLVDSYDLYFLPIANPDGYKFTFNGDRLWRKNRNTYSGGSCMGADLNRNFNIRDWGKEGVSHWVCFDTYCGPSSGSEIETQAIQDAINKILENQKMVAYVSYHCFGNMWVFPPGSTKDHAGKECNVSPIRNQLMNVTDAAVDAIEATHGREGKWLRGGICEVIYPVTGSSGEYAAEQGVTYTFTLELRGGWFVVDKSEIKPSYEEVWNGMIAMLKQIKTIG